MFAPSNDALDFAMIREASACGGFVGDCGFPGSSPPFAPPPLIENVIPTASSSGSNGGIAGAIPGVAGIIGSALPPEAGQILSVAQPLLTQGIGALMSGEFSAASLLSGGSLMAVAGQFLPPQAAQVLSMAPALMGGDPMAMLQGLASKFMPPELQGLFSTAQKMGGLPGLMDTCFPPAAAPELPDTSDSPGPSGGMAPLAARISDNHVCPASDGPKPHVGGPIATGFATVLVGGLPAARIGDAAVCVGPPDAITSGETTVIIGGSAAARLSDSTAHGGKIVAGCPTVVIGKLHDPGMNKECPSAASKGASAIVVPDNILVMH